MKPMAMITGNRSALWPISAARAKETAVRRHDDRGGYHRIPPKRANTGPEHLGDEDLQEGNRGHQPANGDEHVRHGVQAVLKGPAQLRLVIDKVGDPAGDTAGHHKISMSVPMNSMARLLLPVSRPAGSGPGKSWGRPGRSRPGLHGYGRTPSRIPRPCRSRSEPATRWTQWRSPELVDQQAGLGLPVGSPPRRRGRTHLRSWASRGSPPDAGDVVVAVVHAAVLPVDDPHLLALSMKFSASASLQQGHPAGRSSL